MTNRAVVLLSGGQDSTTSLFWAKHTLFRAVLSGEAMGSPELHAVSVHYGQRHAAEIEAAKRIAAIAGCVSHVVLDLDLLSVGGSSALLLENAAQSIAPAGGMRDREMPQGLPTSFVPGRNLLLLAAAAYRAGAIGAHAVVVGVCDTDYSGYPDCRSSFVNAMNAAIGMAWPSMEYAPNIHTPLMEASKAETVRLMKKYAEMSAPHDFRSSPEWTALGQSITCYYGKRPGCGECPACVLRRRGFAEAMVADPAEAP